MYHIQISMWFWLNTIRYNVIEAVIKLQKLRNYKIIDNIIGVFNFTSRISECWITLSNLTIIKSRERKMSRLNITNHKYQVCSLEFSILVKNIILFVTTTSLSLLIVPYRLFCSRLSTLFQHNLILLLTPDSVSERLPVGRQ